MLFEEDKSQTGICDLIYVCTWYNIIKRLWLVDWLWAKNQTAKNKQKFTKFDCITYFKLLSSLAKFSDWYFKNNP